jgi:hypothetical protein
MTARKTASIKDLSQIIFGILHGIQMLLKSRKQVPDLAGHLVSLPMGYGFVF